MSDTCSSNSVAPTVPLTSRIANRRGVPAVGRHWPEYLMEAVELAAFMFSASAFAVLLEHPGSPVRAGLENPAVRRLLMGLAMGTSAVLLIYSPFGRRSGAHMNPAVTMAFVRLGKVPPRDGACYVAAQFLGGVGGMAMASLLLGRALAHQDVGYVVTVPGPLGAWWAFVAEALISGILMFVVLVVSRSKKERSTGLFAGVLLTLWITVEAPLSGTSMNPARTLGSALVAGNFTDLWVYFTAPLLGMLGAAELFRRRPRRDAGCAKLLHQESAPCIFCDSSRRA